METSNRFVIRDATPADGEGIRPLWNALYEHEAKSGMVYHLKSDAFEIWWKEAQGRIGSRFFFLYVAEDTSDASIAAFFCGGVRRKPPIYQQGLVGTATELLVDPRARGHGLAKKLVDRASDFLRAQGIKVFDMMAITGNTESQAFWKKLGWDPEATQYRLDL